MKKIYIVLFFLVTGMANNYAQNKISIPEWETGIRIVQDIDKKIVEVIYACKEMSALSVKIKSEDGKIIFSEDLSEKRTLHRKSIDLKAFDKGIYFVEVDSDSSQQVDRVELN
jgi:hypothetical protein